MGGIIDFVATLIGLSPLAFFLLPPLVLTAGNIYNLFAKKPFHEDSFDKWTFILGPVFMTFLGLFFVGSANWNEPLYFEFVMLESGFIHPWLLGICPRC